MGAVNTVRTEGEIAPEIQRYPVEIDGQRAWLIVKNGQIESINWENGEKITLIDPQADFMKKEQKDEGAGAGLYALAKDVLSEIEKRGVKPVFSVPREYGLDLVQNGLAPRATWIKDVRVLAGTMAIPYYNKEGDRIIAILKNGVTLQQAKIRPRLTGAHPAIFQGVIGTESMLTPDKLIFIDTLDYKVLNNMLGAESEQETINRLRRETGDRIGGL